uniref:Apoptosis-associated speck-like protein containing a CARD n=1 Tax=Maylandia zebra TaxID=106582 RepID=A0A3P9DK92_9CICH
MAKTIKSAVSDTLDDLTKVDFEKFCHQLLDRREPPRVRRNRVEEKSRLQVTDALVSIFTEEGALRVTLEILKQIGCSEEAKELDDKQPLTFFFNFFPFLSPDKHFVDKHRVELTKRVSNIAPILDELLDNEVIDQETYTRIRALSTTQDKMRELYIGPLQAAACKKIFYDILLKNEKFLVKELSEKD